MNTTITNAFKLGHKFLVQNSPAILVGMGVAGVVTTAVLSATGTISALKLIEQNKEEINDSDTELKANIKTVKVAISAYIPAIGVGLATIGVIIAAHKVQSRRTAAIAGVYSLTETAFREYKQQVKEVYGEKKEMAIHDRVKEKQLNQNPHQASDIIVLSGDTLCYDAISGRYFRGDIEKIRRGIHDANHIMYLEDFVSLNELYDLIGLPEVKMGDLMGWSVSNGPIKERFSSHLRNGDTPVLAIDFSLEPKHVN